MSYDPTASLPDRELVAPPMSYNVQGRDWALENDDFVLKKNSISQ